MRNKDISWDKFSWENVLKGFIPEKRAEEYKRYDGVSEKEILTFVEELRAAEILARTVDSNASVFTMDSPIKLKLIRMENGTWEFEFIYRKLKQRAEGLIQLENLANVSYNKIVITKFAQPLLIINQNVVFNFLTG